MSTMSVHDVRDESTVLLLFELLLELLLEFRLNFAWILCQLRACFTSNELRL